MVLCSCPVSGSEHPTWFSSLSPASSKSKLAPKWCSNYNQCVSDVFKHLRKEENTFSYYQTYVKELPGCFGVSRLPAAIFNPLVRDNEVVPLAADLLHRKHVALGGHLLLDALEELRAFPGLVQAPAASNGLDQTQNSLGGEIGDGRKRLLRGSRWHRWSWERTQVSLVSVC